MVFRVKLVFDVWRVNSKNTGRLCLYSFLSGKTKEELDKTIEENCKEILNRNVYDLDGNPLIEYSFSHLEFL